MTTSPPCQLQRKLFLVVEVSGEHHTSATLDLADRPKQNLVIH